MLIWTLNHTQYLKLVLNFNVIFPINFLPNFLCCQNAQVCSITDHLIIYFSMGKHCSFVTICQDPAQRTHTIGTNFLLLGYWQDFFKRFQRVISPQYILLQVTKVIICSCTGWASFAHHLPQTPGYTVTYKHAVIPLLSCKNSQQVYISTSLPVSPRQLQQPHSSRSTQTVIVSPQLEHVHKHRKILLSRMKHCFPRDPATIQLNHL